METTGMKFLEITTIQKLLLSWRGWLEVDSLLHALACSHSNTSYPSGERLLTDHSVLTTVMLCARKSRSLLNYSAKKNMLDMNAYVDAAMDIVLTTNKSRGITTYTPDPDIYLMTNRLSRYGSVLLMLPTMSSSNNSKLNRCLGDMISVRYLSVSKLTTDISSGSLIGKIKRHSSHYRQKLRQHAHRSSSPSSNSSHQIRKIKTVRTKSENKNKNKVVTPLFFFTYTVKTYTRQS